MGNLKLQEDEQVIKYWILNRRKEKIEKLESRHPNITSIKKYFDRVVIDIYKSNTGKSEIDSISVFETKQTVEKISLIDKFEYNFFLFYDYLKINLKILTQKKAEFKEKYLIPLEYKLNSTFYKIKELEKLEKNSESQSILRLPLLSKFKKFESLKWVFKYFQDDSNIDPKANYLVKKIIDKEKLNIQINRKILFNRFKNFWRVALMVKPNYVIEVNDVEKNILKYESTFYKFYKISKFYIVKNIKPLNFQYSKFILFSSFLFLAIKRYSLYGSLEELNKEDEKLNIILNSMAINLQQAQPGQQPRVEFKSLSHQGENKPWQQPDSQLYSDSQYNIKKISNIFDDKLDEIFFNNFKKERQLMTDFENIKDEKIKEEFINKYFISTFQIYFLIGSFFSIYSIFYYKNNRNFITKKFFLKRSLFAIFLLNEVNYYLSFFAFMTCRVIPAEGNPIFNDKMQIIKYKFYRENLVNCYSINKI